MQIFFLAQNSGSPWKSLHNFFLKADICSNASGGAFAGGVDYPCATSKVAAGEFEECPLSEDIQVKEAEAIRAAILMLVVYMSGDVMGKTLKSDT